eukprot:7615502-Alexandrium_andersonii.AAC.1
MASVIARSSPHKARGFKDHLPSLRSFSLEPQRRYSVGLFETALLVWDGYSRHVVQRTFFVAGEIPVAMSVHIRGCSH